MRALQVYLDSSDFSTLASPARRTTQQEAVRDFLLDAQAAGRIALRFSAIHVHEAAPTSPDALPHARERFEMISQLCGTHALAHPLDLMRHETAAARADRPIARAAMLDDTGFWLPSLLEPRHTVPEMTRLFSGEFFTMNREEKRRLLKDGAPSRDALHHFRQHIEAFIAGLRARLPISADAARRIDRYYAGKLDYPHAIDAVRRSMTDPREVANWYRDHSETAHPLSGQMRELGHELKAMLDACQRELDAARASQAADGIADAVLARAISDGFHATFDPGTGELARALAAELSGETLAPSNPWQSLPGLACSTTLTMQLVRRSLALPKPRRASSSDFGDTLHALYLPYVDVFRTDAFAASAIRECAFPSEIATTVVDNFAKLPDSITARLEARTRTTDITA